MNKRSVTLFMLLLLAGGSLVALAAAGHAVYYHNQIMTQNARQINGQTYVPLADVARALGGHVATEGGNYQIVTGTTGSSSGTSDRTAAGGANQVQGANGNIGDWFFNGYWRFQVSKVERADAYQYKYAESSVSDKPSSPSDELVVISATIKNGQKNPDQPILATNGLASQATALTDDQGQSYAPIDFDVRNGSMVPGGAKSFAVIFSVPKGTKLKDLIFTLYGYGTSNKASNVRVNMADQ